MQKQFIRSALFRALLVSILAALLAVQATAALAANVPPSALDTTFAGFTDDGVVTPAGLVRAEDGCSVGWQDRDCRLYGQGQSARRFPLPASWTAG